MYYLRSRPAADPIKFTVDVETLLKSAGEIIKPQEAQEQNELKRGAENDLEEEQNNPLRKKFKPNVDSPDKSEDTNREEAPRVCPMRRKGAPEDEECLACGS